MISYLPEHTEAPKRANAPRLLTNNLTCSGGKDMATEKVSQRMERWRKVDSVEHLEVSNLGRVR